MLGNSLDQGQEETEPEPQGGDQSVSLTGGRRSVCRQLGCAADSPAKGRAWGLELLAEGKWGEPMGEPSFRYKRGRCCSPTSLWAFAV